MIYTVSQLKERFERQYAAGGLEADFARSVLAEIEEAERIQEDETAEASAIESELDDLHAIIDSQENRAFIGENAADKLENGIRGLEEQADKYWEIRGLCVDAGLVSPADVDADLLLLLRMFLPSK